MNETGVNLDVCVQGSSGPPPSFEGSLAYSKSHF